MGNNNYNIAIWVNGGHVTLNGGTYTNEGAGEDDHYDLIYVKGGSLTINGGTFKGQTPAWLVNTHDGHRDSSTIIINGGTFYGFNPANNATENAGTNYVADGYIVVERHGVYTIEESLNAAIADTSVSSVTLAGDVVLTECLRVNHELTLNLNGFDITRPTSVNTQTILVLQNGDLTIEGEGTINGVGSGENDICVWVYGGKLTVNGGTFTNIDSQFSGGAHVIYASHGGDVVINGGEFISNDVKFELNIRDQDRASSSMVVNGGIFHNFNPANNVAEGKHTNFVSNGYKV